MGLFDRFKPRGPRVIGRSLGGSTLLKYDGQEFDNSPVGVESADVHALVSLREAAYEDALGRCQTVFHQVVPFLPHVDVFFYPPTEARPFATYPTFSLDMLVTMATRLGAKITVKLAGEIRRAALRPSIGDRQVPLPIPLFQARQQFSVLQRAS